MPTAYDILGVIFGVISILGCFKLLYGFLKSRQPRAQVELYQAAMRDTHERLAELTRRGFCQENPAGLVGKCSIALAKIQQESYEARCSATDGPPETIMAVLLHSFRHGINCELARDIRRSTQRVESIKSQLGNIPQFATEHSLPLEAKVVQESPPPQALQAQQPYYLRRRNVNPRCEWVHCDMRIEDRSPSGIARHLKHHHDVQIVNDRGRHPCKWGAQPCGKDMYPSSLGKHIAECHLRICFIKRCPHCGAEFARADTLARHIKAFCPNVDA